MIVTFPHKHSPNVAVEFDTDMSTAVFRYPSGGRITSSLTSDAWREQLSEWNINLARLMEEQGDLAVDIGL